MDLEVPNMRKKISNIDQSTAPSASDTVNIVRLKVSKWDARTVGDYNPPQPLNYKLAA